MVYVGSFQTLRGGDYNATSPSTKTSTELRRQGKVEQAGGNSKGKATGEGKRSAYARVPMHLQVLLR